MTKTQSAYVAIPAAALPPGVRFDVPPQHQGQHIEVAYGGFARHAHCHGDLYKRVHDRSLGPDAVTYYKWEVR
jgi:hypothetical protein